MTTITPTSPSADRLRHGIRTAGALTRQAFADALSAEGADHRDWRTLTWLSDPRPTNGHAPRPRRIRSLADRGWITPGNDGWHLTEAGRDLIARLRAHAATIQQRIESAASAEEIETTARTLEAITREFGGEEAITRPQRGHGHRRHGHGSPWRRPEGMGPLREGGPWQGKRGFGPFAGRGSHGGHGEHIHLHLHHEPTSPRPFRHHG